MDKFNPPTKKNQPPSLLEFFNNITTTDNLMEHISNAEFCWHSLLVKGHITNIVAEANAGKTTIMIQAAKDMASSGYEVIYVNVDASASDLKYYHKHSVKNNYKLISPDLSNKSTQEIMNMLSLKAKSEERFEGIVLILDTLKKFVDLMSKGGSREFFRVMRSLTAKGMTVVCLGHCNKHKVDGKLKYEGTGEVRNDVDELIYLYPEKQQDGSITVSTEIDKRRSDAKDMTFLIDKNRNVTAKTEFIDNKQKDLLQREFAKDLPIISFIKECLASGSKSVTDLKAISLNKNPSYSRKCIEKIALKYSKDFNDQPIWESHPALKNGIKYQLINQQTGRGEM